MHDTVRHQYVQGYVALRYKAQLLHVDYDSSTCNSSTTTGVHRLFTLLGLHRQDHYTPTKPVSTTFLRRTFSNMPRQRNSPWARMVPRSDYALVYDEYDPEELRKFVQDRMGPSLDRKEFRTIQNCNRYQLINRLRKLDRDDLFPRFMELPPEPRLNVYEWLLVDPREADGDGISKPWKGVVGELSSVRLHPAVLRTSKQIYKEAHTVLYRTNKFRAGIAYLRDYANHGGGRHSPLDGCALRVTHLGRRNSLDRGVQNLLTVCH